MPKALVVDDEANIRELVRVYLDAADFSVDEAADGITALRLLGERAYDVVVLDIMLPEVDGVEICRRIRRTSDVPVLMLTARREDTQKVAALELGADDYITKPFSPPELVARVRAVLRRATAPSITEAPLAVGELTLDPASREVRVGDRVVMLTAKEFDLLEAMMREPGVVFSRERLLEAAWGFSDYLDARGVDVHIRHIRDKLGDDAAEPRFVETVRGVGYRIRKERD
ncbi:MAG: response regulator transcription factor [Anaerosomatales bacterium]|nr:response regulator transcription factor [Anaerosomatales bacterium]